jgi:RimJ/RimL family protein N-acetyltransferase
VDLAPYTDADLELSIALETDPVVMKELGGPITRERVQKVHIRRVGDPWYLTIVPEPGEPPVGTIGLWPTQHAGETIFETGWMVLPRYQGRGFASAALRELIARASADGGFDAMHAFPPVTNAPSNALCRKFDFELRGEHEFVYADRPLQCNHWVRVLSVPT